MSKRVKKSKESIVAGLVARIPRFAIAILSAVMVALQFLPFWTIDGKEYSISDIVWFIYKNEEVKPYFVQEFYANAELFGAPNKYVINYVILVPVFIFAASVVGFALSFVMKSVWYTLAPICCFLITVIGYIIKPEMRAGAGWYFHFIPVILMMVFVILEFKGVFKKGLQEKK